MHKKGRILLCLLLLVIAVLVLMPKSKTVYGISDGAAYRMITESEEALAPWIWFDISGKTIRYTFSLDERISVVTNGTVEFRHMKLFAISDDGTQTWIFDVIDNDTLVFVARGSTIPVAPDGNAILSDGAEFKRIDK